MDITKQLINQYEEETFLDTKLLQLGLDSRKMYDAAELEIIHFENLPSAKFKQTLHCRVF